MSPNDMRQTKLIQKRVQSFSGEFMSSATFRVFAKTVSIELNRSDVFPKTPYVENRMKAHNRSLPNRIVPHQFPWNACKRK